MKCKITQGLRRNYFQTIDTHKRKPSKVVGPKKEELAQAEGELAAAMAMLAEKQAELKKVVDMLEQLENDFKKSKDKQDELERKSEECPSLRGPAHILRVKKSPNTRHAPQQTQLGL